MSKRVAAFRELPLPAPQLDIAPIGRASPLTPLLFQRAESARYVPPTRQKLPVSDDAGKICRIRDANVPVREKTRSKMFAIGESK